MGFVTPATVLFGLVLLTGGIALLLLGRFKPEARRDSDNIYAAIGIICGLISVASFNVGVGMSLYQMLMTGAICVLMWDNIQKRTSAMEPSKRGRSPHSSKQTYQAELDDQEDWSATEVRRSRRPMRSSRADRYGYEEEAEDWSQPSLERSYSRSRLSPSPNEVDFSTNFSAAPAQRRSRFEAAPAPLEQIGEVEVTPEVGRKLPTARSAPRGSSKRLQETNIPNRSPVPLQDQDNSQRASTRRSSVLSRTSRRSQLNLRSAHPAGSTESSTSPTATGDYADFEPLNGYEEP